MCCTFGGNCFDRYTNILPKYLSILVLIYTLINFFHLCLAFIRSDMKRQNAMNQNQPNFTSNFAFSNEGMSQDLPSSYEHLEIRNAINKPDQSQSVKIKTRKNQVGLEDNVSRKSEVRI